MVLPPILGATALKLKEYFELQGTGELSDVGPAALTAGFLAAFISGLFACSWMIKLVKKSKLDYFAIYCWIVGLIAIVAGLAL
jgi:undecaprenyl-diphosphatase